MKAALAALRHPAFWRGFRRGWLRVHLWLLPAWAWVLFTACKVYLPACQPNEDPPVGVTVHRVSELDDDGGAE